MDRGGRGTLEYQDKASAVRRPAVNRALRLLIDRASIQAHIYGRTGIATGNFINSTERFVSKNTIWEFNVEKANELLDEAGWMRGPHGIRAKEGEKLKLVFQTSNNAPHQKMQAIVKQACQRQVSARYSSR